MGHNKILVIDAGSQYTQLIARRIRELNVYSEIISASKDLDESFLYFTNGIILSGSPYSVHDENTPQFKIGNFIGKIPILGICYGAQFIAKKFSGIIKKSNKREFGKSKLLIIKESLLFKNIPKQFYVWMSHSDTIENIPNFFNVIAKTENINIAAFESFEKKLYGVQFHPEVIHTEYGLEILKNFVFNICNSIPTWTPSNFINEKVNEIKNLVKDEKVIMAVSGGVDSTVASTLIRKAIDKNLYCVFVDTGLLRKNEVQDVLNTYKKLDINLIFKDASNVFFNSLIGISDPEEKRKIIGNLFIRVFEEEAQKIKDVKWLAQGTIYPDVIESGAGGNFSAKIKSHHNVGGLPLKINLKIIEPLKELFKDEVRKIGIELGIPEEVLNRHPFPGPGLAIRIIGEITKEKIKLLQEIDSIFIEELKKHDLYNKVWQAAAILLPIKTVGVMGDERTYEYVVVLRAVNSEDGMTADWSRLPHFFLENVANKIVNYVKGVNRVVYDITSKPPATIEWE